MLGYSPQQKRHRDEFSPSRSSINSSSSSSSKPSIRSDDGGVSGEPISAMLNQLSLEERSKVEYELHGVADLEEETPELLQKRVKEMEKALSDLIVSNGDDTSAYETARKTSKGYVEDLKLVFLRAEAYNGREAAARMVRFFDRKRYLFGEDKLTKDLLLSDMEDEEMEALKQGVLLLLPQRDRSGRAVLVVNGAAHSQYASTKGVMRLLFYISMITVEDVEGGQKRGLVIIYHGFGQSSAVPGRAMEFWKSWRALPIRIVACHYCRDHGSVMGPGVRHFCAIAERLTVCRFRCHYGPLIECMYKLMTFGIPVNDAMPLAGDGRIDLSLHLKMIKEWQTREQEEKRRIVTPDPSRCASPEDGDDHIDYPAPGTYVIPGNLDIVMGRGRHPQSSPGSIQLHNMLRQHRQEYDTATKFDKVAVVKKVLNKLKRSGCRFIKISPGGYQVCEDSSAREKISHGFRNLRLKDGGKGGGGGTSGKSSKRSLGEK